MFSGFPKRGGVREKKNTPLLTSDIIIRKLQTDANFGYVQNMLS